MRGKEEKGMKEKKEGRKMCGEERRRKKSREEEKTEHE